MDILWIIVAYILGLGVSAVGLPPLVGFLGAGFVLGALDYEGGASLQEIADIGVMLLLFTIGLKLRLRTLASPHVWATALIHMSTSVVLFGALVLGLGALGVSAAAGVSLGTAVLIGFALSFSSTVFGVKVLETKGEMRALHGRTAVGILIVQDLLAVAFVAFSAGDTLPSPWALLLLGLPLLRPIFGWLIDRAGHGEMLVLSGILLAFAAYELFYLVGLKGDLGALAIGAMLAGHPKAEELAKVLFGLKELFLVGFFITIGLAGPPTLGALGLALVFMVFVSVKAGLFFYLFTRFKLRARTSLMATLSLSNFGEFGLIVAVAGVAAGWIGSEWLIVSAIAVSISFVVAAPPNAAAHTLFDRACRWLRRWQREQRLAGDEVVDPGDAEVIVFGMGRVGTAAYDFMQQKYGDVVIGVDSDSDIVRGQQKEGRSVIVGDVNDPDFWDRVHRPVSVRAILLALSEHRANLEAVIRLVDDGIGGLISATAKHTDELEELAQAGACAAFNYYEDAGVGFAEHVWQRLEQCPGV